MRCCICGKEIDGFGNNPYPLCGKEDTDSRCCDECNWKFVIPGRVNSAKELKYE
jgi:DNA-directed RNA polymerase subunit RPC12/RpoP